jgi:hypothetical protein
MVTRRKPDNERLLVNLRRFLEELEGLKTEIGEFEEELGLPRSSGDQPWDIRLHRLRARLRDTRAASLVSARSASL